MTILAFTNIFKENISFSVYLIVLYFKYKVKKYDKKKLTTAIQTVYYQKDMEDRQLKGNSKNLYYRLATTYTAFYKKHYRTELIPDQA